MDDVTDLLQPPLIQLGGGVTGALELFPAVWRAAEELVSPLPRVRRQALVKLDEMDAPRLLPLVAYLVATRLEDPNLEIRREAVRITSSLLAKDHRDRPAVEGVRQAAISYLSQMRTRPVYGLLQVAQAAPGSAKEVARLLNACPYAGRQLMDLLADRKKPLAIRREAANFIGLVGYLEAAPALERLEARLTARLSGQQAMPFAPLDPGSAAASEMDLLPGVRRALLMLQAA